MKLISFSSIGLVLILSNLSSIAQANTSGYVTKEPVIKKSAQEQFEGIKVTTETVTPTGDRFRQSNEPQVIKETQTPSSKKPIDKPSFPYSRK